MMTPFLIHQYHREEKRKKLSLSNINKIYQTIEASSRPSSVRKNNSRKTKMKSQSNEEDPEQNIKYEIMLRQMLKKMSNSRYKNNKEYSEKFCQTTRPADQKFQIFQRKLQSARSTQSKKEVLVIQGSSKFKEKRKNLNEKCKSEQKSLGSIYPIMEEVKEQKGSWSWTRPYKTIFKEYEKFITNKKEKKTYEQEKERVKFHQYISQLKQEKNQCKKEKKINNNRFFNESKKRKLEKKIKEDTPLINGWDILCQDEQHAHF